MTDSIVPITGFHWKPADQTSREAGGKTLLINSSSEVVGVFDYYNYVVLLDPCTLLVWNQKRRSPVDRPSSPVELFIVGLGSLEPIREDIDALMKRLNDEESFFVLGGYPSTQLSLSTTDVMTECHANFPESIATSLDELLIICHSSALRGASELGDVALLVAAPGRATFNLYPQDWFNDSKPDFGYEWITRVARNPLTNHIEGEGFRINPFVLDDSLCQLGGWPMSG